MNKNIMLRLSATNIIIIVTAICYFLIDKIENGNVLFGLNKFFFEGFYFQILTTIFVHANFEHLLFNMIALWQFGNIVEYLLGKIRFLFIYLIGAVLSSFLVLFYIDFQDNFINVVGASSAISVILGLVAVIDSYNRKGIIIWFLIITFAPLLFGMPIAWFGHLAGFFVGALFGFYYAK